MSQSAAGAYQPAIVASEIAAKRGSIMNRVAQVGGVLIGIGCVANLFFGDGADTQYRGSDISPEMLALLGVAMAVASVVWFFVERRQGASRFEYVGFTRIQGGIELKGLRGVSKGKTLAIPDRAPVAIAARRTARARGTVQLYGVVVAWQGGQELFDMRLMTKGIDVAPLVRALRAMGCPVQIDPKLGGDQVGYGTPAAAQQPMQPAAPLQPAPMSPAPMQPQAYAPQTFTPQQ